LKCLIRGFNFVLVGGEVSYLNHNPQRFRKSCYVGLQPGRRNSGQGEPQLHISKEGDPYLRTLLVQGAHHILGPFGAEGDLRRWGLKLAERGGKNGKKGAVIATAGQFTR
jgi:transposase